MDNITLTCKELNIRTNVEDEKLKVNEIVCKNILVDKIIKDIVEPDCEATSSNSNELDIDTNTSACKAFDETASELQEKLNCYEQTLGFIQAAVESESGYESVTDTSRFFFFCKIFCFSKYYFKISRLQI